ncbi:MFS transporter [Microbulbifer aggregans]|uniref:MFS transporter n=1 Tax=Microbulbifer aggregans TaxID=1769779 RepID=UPI001CFDA8FB|nr:MFS transporter [Microbulbifer aggregans]
MSTSNTAPGYINSHKRRDKTATFERSFYIANVMEIFERLAWYGFFTLSSLYMSNPTEDGGMGFSDIERGTIQGVIPFILYLLPVFTGALGDRYGYKRMFFIAFAIMTPAYYLLGQVQGFWPFFIVLLSVAIGAAIFKPLVVATVSRTTNAENRSVGFGIFYTMINVGGFIGPIIAGVIKGISWEWVFGVTAFWIAINFLLLLLYKDPSIQDSGSSAASTELRSVFRDIGLVLTNRSFVLYLLIMSGFWACYNQLFLTLPLYIRDFVDTSPLLREIENLSPTVAQAIASTDGRQISPEFITAFNFGSILALQIFISRYCRGVPTVPVIVSGTVVMATSFLWLGYGVVASGLGVIAAVLLFSVGEMLASPKSQEYVAEVAPKEQSALFMGYYFLSMALGFLIAGLLSGWAYATLVKSMNRPDLLWGGFAALAIITAIGQLWYHRHLRGQH